MPGTGLGAEDAEANSTVPASWELGASWRESKEGSEAREVWEHGREQVNLAGR